MRAILSPPQLEQLVVKAAKWMWGKPSVTSIGWSPAALTPANAQDPTNPQMTIEEAEAVFEVLSSRDLIVPAAFTSTVNGQTVISTGYTLNQQRVSEWARLMRKNGWFALWLRPWAEDIWGRKRTALWAFVYALVLAFFAKIIEHIVDVLWKHYVG